jgi:hypothetical protein
MTRLGIIKAYAIGGGIAATYYIEPILKKRTSTGSSWPGSWINTGWGTGSRSWKGLCMKNEPAKTVLEKKRARRRELAKLPFERKIAIIVELQKAASGIRDDRKHVIWPH